MNDNKNKRWANLSLVDNGTLKNIGLYKSRFTIGRMADNDLQLEDPYVSRYHAEIIFDGMNYTFRDKGSTSGSFVNGNRVTEQILHHDDRICLGRKTGLELVFQETHIEKQLIHADTLDSATHLMSVIDHQQTRYLNTSLIKGKVVNIDTINRLKTLYEITSSILSIRTREDLVSKVLDLLFDALPAERGVIMLKDPKEGLKIKVSKHRTSQENNTVQPSLTVVNHVFQENVATLSIDAYSDSRFSSQNSIIAQAIRSVMCAPISSATQIWGIVYVDTISLKNNFKEEELEFLLAISRQAGVALENIHLIEEQKITLESFITTLAASIDARDDLTAGHSARVAKYSRSCAKHMGLSLEEVRIIYYAGLLHDYGKIGTREAILCKPGRLTDEEMEHMRLHAYDTHKILSKIHFTKDLEEIPAIAASHHEHVDGSGYPFGFTGDKIPIGGKIIAVADFFDALTHKRHYREPMPLEEVIQLIDDQTGTKFDSEVVAAFKDYVYKDYIPKQKKRAEMDRLKENRVVAAKVKTEEPLPLPVESSEDVDTANTQSLSNAN
jgi:HD-GYP domain-containing protein (c-di-GMP phosphodiesterase class II)